MTRALAGLLIGLVAAGGAAAAAGAQAPAPVVTLTFTGDGPPAVAGAERLPGGATTFRVVDHRRVRRGRDVALVRLEPGRTLADATPVLARVDEEGPPVLRGVAAIDHWLSSEPGRIVTRTVALRPGATYALVDAAQGDAAPIPLAVGDAPPYPALTPPAATVTMRDYGFRGPAVLPSSGTVRVVNRGARYHEILAIRLERGARSRTVRRQLRRGADPEKIRRISFSSFFIPPVAPGAVNDVPAATLRQGRYVLVCLYGDRESRNRSHVTLGMERAVRVR